MTELDSTEASATDAPETVATLAEGVSSEPPLPGADAPEGGDPTTEPAKKEEPPSVDKLARWSQKLQRRNPKVETARAELAKQRAELDARAKQLEQTEARAKEAAELLESNPSELLDRLAKRNGTTVAEEYERWMHRVMTDNDPAKVAERTAERRVKEALAAEREAAAKQAAEAKAAGWEQQKQTFRVNTAAYVPNVLSKYPAISAYGAQAVADRAVNFILETYEKTGVAHPLDDVLQALENGTRAEFERIQGVLGAKTQPPGQVNGAGKAASPAARQRGVTNGMTTELGSASGDDDDISDKALTAKAIAVARKNGWR